MGQRYVAVWCSDVGWTVFRADVISIVAPLNGYARITERTGNVYNTLALLDTVVEALLWARQ